MKQHFPLDAVHYNFDNICDVRLGFVVFQKNFVFSELLHCIDTAVEGKALHRVFISVQAAHNELCLSGYNTH